ncbi:MAG: DNA mismatch repair protein MutS, partial [Clostridiaceae bacterium]|nr:DNA mismatch repair protein MutS [Clostridiaceae bacterium]
KLSIAMKAIPLPISAERKLEIKAGRHPLLKADTIIPLDFRIGGEYKGVVITGPNTGGKTVALKTIGLLSLMAQSGLHVPADGGCFTMHNYVLCDIGDGQSITENLSTFSSHMTNIIKILRLADDQSLVLLDELGSGTDPAEGMGLAIAIIEELVRKNCLFVATTHYPEIKDFAKVTPGLVNARMAFDLQSLLPLYKLEIGEAGESCALYIARRLGLSQKMIERARIAAYGEGFAEKSKKANNSDLNIPLQVTEPIVMNTETNEFPKKRIQKQKTKKTPDNPRSMSFSIGDSVMVYPDKIIGIVYQKANERGDVGVQIRNKKLLINHKRLKLHVPASELYPENYDFSIIFDSVETRKKRHDMERKHDPNIIIETDSEKRG